MEQLGILKRDFLDKPYIVLHSADKIQSFLHHRKVIGDNSVHIACVLGPGRISNEEKMTLNQPSALRGPGGASVICCSLPCIRVTLITRVVSVLFRNDIT